MNKTKNLDKIKVGDWVGDKDCKNVFQVKYISKNIMLLERVKEK